MCVEYRGSGDRSVLGTLGPCDLLEDLDLVDVPRPLVVVLGGARAAGRGEDIGFRIEHDNPEPFGTVDGAEPLSVRESG